MSRIRRARSRAARPWESVAPLLFLFLVGLPGCAPVAPIGPHAIPVPGPVGPQASAPRPSAPQPAKPAPHAAQSETKRQGASETLSVAAFNIQVFGRTKRSKADVMTVLTTVAREVDVLLVQEIRDSSEYTADFFLEAINKGNDRQYAMYEGPRLGRTSSKEQYVVYYALDRARLLDAYTLPDPKDEFEREPLVATFRAGNFDFSVVGCHIKPDDAEQELRALSRAVDTLLAKNPEERDLILLGDFNADGSYLDERRLTEIFPTDQYHIAIPNDVDTMTTSDNTYDRIILRHETVSSEYVKASAQVVEFDQLLKLDDEKFVRSVSDHYPVIARFRTTSADDDGS